MTIHNKAKKNDIAKVVLMPGDPLRAKWIAKNYLKSPRLVNDVRNMYCYTGFYKNTRVTVMGSGMGIPSIGIYSYELFKVYQVKTIIRIGSAGGFVKDLKLGDIVITDKAYSKSNYANDIGVKTPLDRVLQASPTLLKTCTNTAKKLQLTPHIGKILSEDAFYSAIPWQKRMQFSPGIIAVEMEAFALYANAIKAKANAISLLTISDSFVSKKTMSAIERQTSFKQMVTLALETAIQL